jgi:hypothetical protein
MDSNMWLHPAVMPLVDSNRYFHNRMRTAMSVYNMQVMLLLLLLLLLLCKLLVLARYIKVG